MKKNQILNLKLAVLILGWTLTFQANILNAQVKNNAEQNFNNYLQNVILSSPQEISIFLQNKDYLQQLLELKGTDRELAQQLLVELEMRLVTDSNFFPLQKIRHESINTETDESLELMEKVRKLNFFFMKNNTKSELRNGLQNQQNRTAAPKFTFNSNRTSSTAQDVPWKVETSADFPEMKNGFKSIGFREAIALNGEFNLQTQQANKEMENRMFEEMEKQYREYNASLRMVFTDEISNKNVAKKNYLVGNQPTGEMDKEAKFREELRTWHQKEMKEKIKHVQEEVMNKFRAFQASSESRENVLKSALSTSSVSETDSLALVALYNATNGPNWNNNTNWLAGPVNTWYGVTVLSGRVFSLELLENNLNGELPAEIGQLTNLIELALGYNKLTGNIPTELSLLSNLEYLFLPDNQLSGTIPSELGMLANLLYLELGWNQLSGSIPAEIGNLANLNSLFLGGNPLSGNLPAEITYLTNLIDLYLSGTQLSGSLPEGFDQLSNLKNLYLQYCQFEGVIPAEIFQNLEWCNVKNNNFNELPEITNTTNFYYLVLQNNNFTFEDLEYNMDIPFLQTPWGGDPTFNYSPQKPFGEKYKVVLNRGENYTLAVVCDGTQNNYQWFFQGKALNEPNVASEFELQNIDFSNSGLYFCQVTNSLVPGLILQSEPITIQLVEPPCNPQDSMALVALYNATSGPNWNNNSNWQTTEPVKNWYGITTLGGKVIEIQLNNNNLNGNLPAEIGLLDELTILRLNHNKISGSVPVELGNLTFLKILEIWNNLLTGKIPSELCQLENLKYLDLDVNQFSGSIPKEIGNLKNLITVYFSNNQLTGSIPEEISHMTLLQHFMVYNNLLDSLPDITIPVNLSYLHLNNNKFAFDDMEYNMDLREVLNFGYIPQLKFGEQELIAVSLGDSIVLNGTCGGSQNNYQWYFEGNAITEFTSNPTFTVKDFGDGKAGYYHCIVTNSLVPDLTLQSEFKLLYEAQPPVSSQDSLILVEFYNQTNGPNWIENTNWLAGPVHLWHGITLENQRVTGINLAQNYLSGSLPASLSGLSELNTLQLHHNALMGTIPTEFGKFTQLEVLELWDNQLEGTIPPELGNLSTLRVLDIGENYLTGSIPPELGNLSNLTDLWIYRMGINGAIPPELGQLSNLQVLGLPYCQLSGEIPTEIGQLTNLTTLYLYNNQLNGNIPEEIWNLEFLTDVGLFYNQLSGNLSATVANADSLVYLNLSNNLLEGQIPDAIWDTPRLRTLNLGYNLFSGPITTAVTNAGSLRTLYLNSNKLEGPIPDELWSIPNLTSLNLSNNPLGGTLSPLVANASYLTNLYLSGNQLSVELPAELANTNINYLTLMNNLFEGEIPEVLSEMPSLNNLRIDGNKFTGIIPESLLKKLQIFTLSNNLLDSMPNIDNPVNLTYFYSYNNFLTFEDLEYNMDMQVQYDHLYYPQNLIGKPDTIYVSLGNRLTLNIPCGGTQNYYRWYKDSVSVNDLSTLGEYEKYNFSALDTGSYYVTVENPLVPNLILHSHPVQIYLADEICTELYFKSGWNLFSVPVHSEPANIKDLFQPFIDNTSLVKIQDEQGNSLEDWGMLGGWKNYIGEVGPTEGYKTKTNSDVYLVVCGGPVQYPFEIPLETGWNIIGFPQTSSSNAMEVLQQLIDRGSLIKVQDETGKAIEDWGMLGGWKNYIGDFLPGKGYKIKLASTDILTINEAYPKTLTISSKTADTKHFLTVYEGNGVDHMNFNISELPISLLQPGDELAIFDGERCVGAVTLLPWHLNSAVVSIAASAADDIGMSGFTEGNTFTLKFWSSNLNQEYVLEPEILKGTATFVKHESTLLSLEKYASTGLDDELLANKTEINCYPNPFSDEVTIEINLDEDAEVQVDVYSQMGQLVKNLASKQQLFQGTHKLIWNGSNEENNRSTTGMYHLKVIINNEIHYKRIIYSE